MIWCQYVVKLLSGDRQKPNHNRLIDIIQLYNDVYIKTYKIPKTTMKGESPDPAFARQIYHVFVSDMRLEPDLLLVDNYD